MYEAVKEWMLWLMRVPPEPLDPMGDVASLRVFRAAPGYLRYRIFLWALKQAGAFLVAVVSIIPLVTMTMREGHGAIILALEMLVILFFPIQAAFSFFVLRLDYEVRWYKITDRSLRIREGVVSVHEMTMTFANIQNIGVSQGPVQRLFGISDVRVETAGGGGTMTAQKDRRQAMAQMHVGVFRGVDTPDEIRDLMLSRLRRLRDTGLGDWDQASADREAVPAPAMPTAATDDAQLIALIDALRAEASAMRRAAESAIPRASGGP
jgi:membrane protein YdbS with pleckstrin-like domain